MNNWCKRTALLVIVIGGIVGTKLSGINAHEIQIALNNNYETKANQRAEVNQNESKFLAQNTSSCHQINLTYQEVYSFETEDFYISICQLENSFFYYREPKSNQEDTLLIPAQAMFSGDVFQATSGKTIYFVGRDGDRYYSSVMQNNSEIVFEPELQSPPPKVATSGYEVSNISSTSSSHDANRGQVELGGSENNVKQSSVCTKNKSALHPHLDGWQKLIGKSTDTANEYALNNGHSFISHEHTPDKALIKTETGAIINLDVATVSNVIEQVCVQPGV
ncbi:hypothetical protein [Pleurocapsa sp. PCC 7319]|uniref:hypothetical protein n=1 Tax=Pleurocapsa sp. PCC 7319 TaxID=118161 RepID=UPI0003494B5C|nr:hypothetical protein [Pleurocapsa sp. PCC 7319]